MTTAAQQQGACTSPPAELKEFNGAIAALDYDKRILTMHDEHGVTHPFKWTNEAQDEFFQKQRVGYGLTLKYDGETRVLKGANFWRKPDGFNKKAGGGRPYQPRNEKPMVYLCAYKEACETIRALILQPDAVLDEAEFNRVMDIAIARALKDGEALCRAGGA